MAGALHALDRAVQLGYHDRRGRMPNVRAFASEFRSTLKDIGRGRSLPEQWRAGFYFLSALFRLAALIDRLRKRFGKWPDNRTRSNLMADVDRIKHNPIAHPVARLATQFDDALAVADAIGVRLEQRLR